MENRIEKISANKTLTLVVRGPHPITIAYREAVKWNSYDHRVNFLSK
jgi:hypothetical protein